jgi:hypothetical protein
MANVWDDLMKMLVRAHPQDFVSFVNYHEAKDPVVFSSNLNKKPAVS